MKQEYNKTTLAIVSGLDYRKSSLEITKSIANKEIIYTTFNKTYPAIDEFLRNNDINTNKIQYIDTISKSTKNKNQDNCHFIESPESLTELSILLKDLTSKKPKYVVIDSITNLLNYSSKEIISKFILDLLKSLEKNKSNLICYATAGSGGEIRRISK